MIREKDILDQENTDRAKEQQYLQSVIEESARYERLMVNKDFQDVLADLKDVVKIHDRQISLLVSEKYQTDDPTERAKIDNTLAVHVIRKDQAEEFAKRPEKIISLAQNARERLAQLKEKDHADRH